ncbi:3'-5' exonuclease [Botryobacter ruber]|uniref:3'-5' exonuclease n=1 Tax=Botryobacter ruber TaxID=2171629 RepID=UPI0013E328E4|nr:3'-5' exonuclease [Botryobacter ruber]
MRDFLLFIDTEASGLPKDWNAPYSEPGNWPYNVQLAWIIYTRHGEEVKAENHYISDDDFEISAAAGKIHGITRAFLLKHGKRRSDVLTLLADDLQQYKPMLIGHFMQLDLHMMGVAFYRAGLDFPLHEYPTFCTMESTTFYSRNLRRRYLRLNELHRILFGTEPEQQHDALADARATARCFFELCQRGEVDDAVIEQQQHPKGIREKAESWAPGCLSAFFVIFVVLILTLYW